MQNKLQTTGFPPQTPLGSLQRSPDPKLNFTGIEISKNTRTFDRLAMKLGSNASREEQSQWIHTQSLGDQKESIDRLCVEGSRHIEQTE